jgi:hypothetical protein
MTTPAPGWFARRLARHCRQFLPQPPKPVLFRSFDPEFLDLVRQVLAGLPGDPTPDTTPATRMHVSGNG